MVLRSVVWILRRLLQARALLHQRFLLAGGLYDGPEFAVGLSESDVAEPAVRLASGDGPVSAGQRWRRHSAVARGEASLGGGSAATACSTASCRGHRSESGRAAATAVCGQHAAPGARSQSADLRGFVQP